MASIRLHVVYGIESSVPEDVRVTTHDFIVTPPWPAAAPQNYEEGEAAYDAFFEHLRGISFWGTSLRLREYRWYREDDDVTPWGEASRITARNLAPTGYVSNLTPPQVACSVTERTELRRHWGRFYLPGVGTTALTGTGRLSNPAGVADGARALYDRWSAAGLIPIVRARVRTSQGLLPGTQVVPTMLEVRAVQVDDVLDVVRSRRYESVTSRQARAVIDRTP